MNCPSRTIVYKTVSVEGLFVETGSRYGICQFVSTGIPKGILLIYVSLLPYIKTLVNTSTISHKGILYL
jgi:hypothetical protein